MRLLIPLLVLALCGCAGTATVETPTAASTSPTTAEEDGGDQDPRQGGDEATEPGAGVPDGTLLALRVVGERPHDPTAFTQGLEFDDGRLFESRGLYGESAVTEIDPATGEVIASTELAPTFFGEGLTVVGDEIIQITWQEQTAFVYDRDTLQQTRTMPYTGQGWGICDDGDVVHMSNGSATLTTRDPLTFLPTATVEVTRDGEPVERLNELECVDGRVWANVWQTNTIVVIDPDTGEVESTIDASAIAQPSGRWAVDGQAADVLNGIALDPQTGTWLVTGKQWPLTYEVEFVCVEGCSEQAAQAGPHYVRVSR